MGNTLTKCCTEDVNLRKRRDRLSKASPTLRVVNNDSSSTNQDEIELPAPAITSSTSVQPEETTTSNTLDNSKTSSRKSIAFLKQISSSFSKKPASASNSKSLSLEQGLEQHFPFPLTPEERKVLLQNEIPSSEIEKLSIGVDGGGMGIIHVAEWKGIKVAIKEAALDVITKEVEIYSRMKGCDGVVQFYGVTYPPGLDKLCIVTKYAEFGSLSWYLKVEYHKLDWSRKLHMATQVANAMMRLHQEGIYHRDIHCGNVLVDAQGNAMLTDFGASTVMEKRVAKTMNDYEVQTVTTADGASKYTSRKMPSAEELSASTSGDCTSSKKPKCEAKKDPLIGVMAYIAPERFRNPREFDARCDIYSLGVLFWVFSSGHPPFAGVVQDVPLVVSILNGQREQPVEGTPPKYQELYERCWDADPAKRPTLDEIMDTLAKVRESMTPEELAVTRTRPERVSEDGSSIGSEFEESISVPRPTSELQSYIISDSIEH